MSMRMTKGQKSVIEKDKNLNNKSVKLFSFIWMSDCANFAFHGKIYSHSPGNTAEAKEIFDNRTS